MPGFDPQNPPQSAGMVRTCNPSAGEVKTDLWGSQATQPSLLGKLKASERSCL